MTKQTPEYTPGSRGEVRHYRVHFTLGDSTYGHSDQWASSPNQAEDQAVSSGACSYADVDSVTELKED
jgi:hypothetical protein